MSDPRALLEQVAAAQAELAEAAQAGFAAQTDAVASALRNLLQSLGYTRFEAAVGERFEPGGWSVSAMSTGRRAWSWPRSGRGMWPARWSCGRPGCRWPPPEEDPDEAAVVDAFSELAVELVWPSTAPDEDPDRVNAINQHAEAVAGCGRHRTANLPHRRSRSS